MNRRMRKKLQAKLADALYCDDPERLAALLRAGADPLVHRDGETALYRASVQGAAGNVRVLLEAGAPPNEECDAGLPLCGAACWGHDDAVRELLAAGADPLLKEHGTLSALEWAERGGYDSTVALLRG
ncbi:serine/threonine protein kinase [Winogradskya consettensis]|uniref:Serine/threonine protein kinase n=2 Tax=Winogradskya consettensis TaxID=113560 RepID=A0A919SXG1_9ACTN|nr:serine/threonine protein kinase [Actinoplanes consettensis]